MNKEDNKSRWKAFKWDDVQEKDFVMNFMQRASKVKAKKSNSKSKQTEYNDKDYRELLNDELKAKLTSYHTHESKQRVLVYIIVCSRSNGSMYFNEFWDIFKYGMSFFKMYDGQLNRGYITQSSIAANINKLRIELPTNDANMIENLEQDRLKNHELQTFPWIHA